jgi:hypothetical protein
MLVGAFGLMLAGLSLACSGDSACDQYVDYICDCHADDPAYDCDALRTSYEAADDSLQDECSLALDSLETQDEQDGTGCVVEDSGGDSGAGGDSGTGGDSGATGR